MSSRILASRILASRILTWIVGIVVSAYAAMVALTLAWTLTGHCCGAPFVTTSWDHCLPAGDKMPLAFLRSGRCDPITWKRVP